MWDAARLDSKAKDRIEFEWLEIWGGGDPSEKSYDSSVTAERYTEG